MSKQSNKEDFMRAMFPSSYPGANEPPQEIKYVEEDVIAAKEAKQAEEKAKEHHSPAEEVPVKINTEMEEETPVMETSSMKSNENSRKKSVQNNDPENSGISKKKSQYYFCRISRSDDAKLREIANREEMSLSEVLGKVIRKMISEYERVNGEVVIKEKKSRPKTKKFFMD